ncbi:hypothetical protein [Tsukamurella spumae]|uniref:Uncharacterized protein n=1 Tax=Tsukamurella spumae TaxID=44753 RepID=A0A846X465_9ACTN|nr:hypothetical protein [Tsukamurella spumae]NKY20288.1 hypothetical protein [Tsukamurella spumae]
MSADRTATETGAALRRGFSPALLIAGIAAIVIAVWGAVGGPSLISAGTLVGGLAIAAVAVAGVLLIRPRTGSDSPKPTASGSSPDDQ